MNSIVTNTFKFADKLEIKLSAMTVFQKKVCFLAAIALACGLCCICFYKIFKAKKLLPSTTVKTTHEKTGELQKTLGSPLNASLKNTGKRDEGEPKTNAGITLNPDKQKIVTSNESEKGDETAKTIDIQSFDQNDHAVKSELVQSKDPQQVNVPNSVGVPIKKTVQQRLQKNCEYALDQQQQEIDKDLLKTGLCPFKRNEDFISYRDLQVGSQGLREGHAGLGPKFKWLDDHFKIFKTEKTHGPGSSCQIFGIFENSEKNDYKARQYIEIYFARAFKRFNMDKITEEGMYKALKYCFDSMNAEIRAPTQATVVVAVLDKIYIANLGNCRALFVKDGKIRQATEDANPSFPRYKKKIEKLGGEVVNGKLGGVYSTARSLGFHTYSGMSPEPEISCYSYDAVKEGYLILGSSSLFKAGSTREIGQVVHQLVMQPRRDRGSTFHSLEEDIAARLVMTAKLKDSQLTDLGAMVIKVDKEHW